MPAMLYPNSGALWVAGEMQASLAAAEVALFKSGTITLSPTTTLTELDAVEADFTGYARETVTAWLDPLLNPLGGASIESGTIQFAIASPYTTGNTIQGWYVVESGGELVCAGDFPSFISLAGAGDGIPMNVQLVFG